ncbi:MAG TPA: FtsX-like permease family protein [Micromonosporaceae bacterium]
MSPLTLYRLARAGTRTDTLRMTMTAVSATLATLTLLAAATVLAIPGGSPGDGSQGWSPQYRNPLLVEPGLRPGVALALVLLTVPVLALAGQCGRLGAPARDRRLAALRLAGATPGQAVAVATAETGGASALGAVLGLAAYLVGRVLAGHPGADGKLALPTDVLPAPWALVAICLGVPLLASAAAALLLRRVAWTPFGVVRRVRRRPPRPWPGMLIALGVAAFAGLTPLLRFANRHHLDGTKLIPTMLFGGGLLASLGVVVGTGWLSHAAGRLLHRGARRPAALLAARRLVADPWSNSRTLAALLTAVIFGSGAAAVRAWFATEFAVRDDVARWRAAQAGQPFVAGAGAASDDFYFRSLDLVDTAVAAAIAIAAAGMLVAIAEGVVSRRRAYAALVATGIPRGVLARSILWQTLAPTAIALLVALGVGVALVRGIVTESRAGGYDERICTAGAACGDPSRAADVVTILHVPEFVRAVPVPVTDLALLGVGALAAVVLVTGVGLLVLRSSTAVEELRSA